MMGHAERLQSLLVDRVTEGLNREHQKELEGLLLAVPEPDAAGFELAAAAIELAYVEDEPLPQALRQRLEDQQRGFFEGRKQKERLATVLPFSTYQVPAESLRPQGSPRWLGWAVATAAALLAALGWAPRMAEQLAESPTKAVRASLPGTEERRSELLGRSEEVLRVAWTPTEDPAAESVSGDLVWSNVGQEGYMLFEGLPINDPTEWQYQLWIFDRMQDERFPVDGGVFDVTKSTAIIPIRASLQVRKPYLFAITIEKPGGVVVSDRQRLPLLASI